ncbi:MAG: carboxypeptidase regulatory-like domain-containing protein [Acidobacteriota bacterium]
MHILRHLAPILLTFPVLLSAQEYRGTILGRVSDPSGSVIVGAAIQVVNIDTNIVTKTSSNELGNYVVPFLIPGNYRVTVGHQGFKKAEREGLRVSTDVRITLDFTLELGATTESVTVTAGAPLLNTAGADLGQVVESVYVLMTPVALNRNALNATQLAPGITGSTGTYTSESQSNFRMSGGGATSYGNEILVDGLPNAVPRAAQAIFYMPTLDATEEVKVYTTLFDAAYGRSNGGVVNITTKSGTNKLHGALYEFKRWKVLNANSWSNNRLGLRKTPVNYYQWGYTVGGPVYLPRIYNGRNRTFFSTSLERDSNVRDMSPLARVPTDLERKGDFSQTLSAIGGAFAIYDPVSTVVTGSQARRQPFPNAQIPAARVSPIGAAVLALYPLPNLPGKAQIGRYNWAAPGTYTVAQKQVAVRVDHAISDSQRLFGRFSQMLRDEAPITFFAGLGGLPGSENDNMDIGHKTQWSAALDDTLTLSPSLVGSLRYGYSRLLVRYARGGAGLDAGQLHLPDAILRNQAANGLPNFNLGENMATIGGGTLSLNATDMHVLAATLTKLRGGHTLKFGGDYRLIRWNQVAPGATAFGTFNFNSVFTQADPFANASAETSGTGLASLLLAAPASGSIGFRSPTSLQQHYLAGFIQEDWKLSPRLTLNFGFRWELETPYTERYDRASYGFDSQARLPVQVPGMDLRGGLLFAGVNGNPRRQGNLDRNNFGPRFGFAFSPASRTVIRGGYGLFYSAQAMNSSFRGQVAVFDAETSYLGSIDRGATMYTTLENPFPTGLRQPLSNSVGPMALVGDGLSYFHQGRVSPYNQQWQFSIQRELPSQILVEAAYMGMRSLKELQNFNLNEKPDKYLALGVAENNRLPNPFLGIFPSASTLGQGATITQRQLWYAYPQFTSLTVQGVNTGTAIYHALQMKVEKRLTRGLNFLWTYTNSKLFSSNVVSLVNERHYRSIASGDQAQVMRLAFIYQLPFHLDSQGWKKAARQVAEGWSLGGFLSLATGTPLSVSQANGRPVRIRNPRVEGPISERLGDRRDAGGNVLNPFFDINAFRALPDQYTISPEPPVFAELRAPGVRSLNLSLFKSFTLRERLRVEVRLESTNLTNTPGFSAPGTNMSNRATFGVINSAGGGRGMQAGARLAF